MKLSRRSMPLAGIVVVCAMCLIAGCGMYNVESAWRDREVVVNGVDGGTEWENARYYIEDKKITVGLMNDEDHLYIRLSSHERAIQRQIVMGGLTVWLNEKGNRAKTLGIHFPVSMRRSSPGMMPDREMASAENYDEMMRNRLMDVTKTLEIIGPEKNSRKMMSLAIADSLGVRIGMAFMKGNIVYEIRVPLMRDRSAPCGICTGESNTIGIGLISTASTRREGGRPGGDRGRSGGGMGGRDTGMGGQDGGMGGMGGMGGRGGGMGGRGGGMPDMSQMPQSLEMWLKVQVAESQ